MRLFGRARPDIAKLRERGDLDGLHAALRYRDVVAGADGSRRDRGTAVRLRAIASLSDLYGPTVATFLIEALADEDPAVRAAAANGLIKLGVPSIDPLLDGLVMWKAPPYDDAVRAALDALASSQTKNLPEAFVDRLIDLRDSPLQEWHPQALNVLLAADPRSESGRKAVAEHVVCRIERAEEGLDRERAEQVLGWLGQASADAVVAALAGGNADPALTRRAGEQRDARAVDSLIRMLARPDAEVRAAAATALGKIRDTRAVPSLLSLTQDPELAVREAALDGLDAIGLAAVVFGLASLGEGGGGAQLANGAAAAGLGQQADWAERAAARLARLVHTRE